MALLAQQELLEAPPARRLIVPAGHTAWWGVDPSTQRIAVAGTHVAPDRAFTVSTASFASGRGGQRLSLIHAETRAFVTRLLEGGWTPPGYVLFELPAGNPPNVELIYAAGVQQAAVYDAVLAVTGRPVVIETMPTSRWKLLACGSGKLYKPDPKKGRIGPYGVLVWAQQNGYAGKSFDEADAMGIAEAARRSVALEQR